MLRVGFTGSRKGVSAEQRARLAEVLAVLGASRAELHHGVCVGADEEAHRLGRKYGYRVVGHPPKEQALRSQLPYHYDEEREAKTYLARDMDIVVETHVLVACPGAARQAAWRSGTWATIAMAQKLGRPIFVVLPDGTWTFEEDGR